MPAPAARTGGDLTPEPADAPLSQFMILHYHRVAVTNRRRMCSVDA